MVGCFDGQHRLGALLFLAFVPEYDGQAVTHLKLAYGCCLEERLTILTKIGVMSPESPVSQKESSAKCKLKLTYSSILVFSWLFSARTLSCMSCGKWDKRSRLPLSSTDTSSERRKVYKVWTMDIIH